MCYTGLVIKVIDFDLFFSEGAQVPIIYVTNYKHIGEHTKGETHHGKRHSKVV